MSDSRFEITNHKSQIPFNRIANGDLATLDDFGERAAAPALAHRGLQSRQRFIHPLARLYLSVDAEARRADAQRLSPAVEQIEGIDHEIDPPRARLQSAAQAIHQRVPPFQIDDRYLSLPALIRVADDPAAGDQRRLSGRVHLSAMGTLDPDLVKHGHRLSLYRALGLSTAMSHVRSDEPDAAPDCRHGRPSCVEKFPGLLSAAVQPDQRIRGCAAAVRRLHGLRTA